MVSRDDIKRIADLQRKSKRVTHNLNVILWDTDDIADLMPLIEKPIANLEQFSSDTCVILSLKRLRSEQQRVVFTIYNADNVAFRETGPSPESRHLPPLPEDATDRRIGMVTLDEDAYNKAEMIGFLAETFMWGDDGSFGVIGTMFRKSPDTGFMEQTDNVSMVGMPWTDKIPRIEVYNRRLQPELEEKFESAWRYVVSYAQNIAWCVQHPDQFPIVLSTAASSTLHKEHKRLAKKEHVDLEQIRVIELRPRVHLVREQPTGNHRDFKYSFFVRGHWRHYPSGTVAWVAGYWKAVDKPRLEVTTITRF